MLMQKTWRCLGHNEIQGQSKTIKNDIFRYTIKNFCWKFCSEAQNIYRKHDEHS
jgi:hypothetical protein